MRKKLFLLSFIVLIIGCSAIAYISNVIWGANVPEKLEQEYFYIPSNSNFERVMHKLHDEKFIESLTSFKDVAKLMKYGDGKIKSGKYKIVPGSSNRQLVQMLRSGQQTPTSITFNNVRTIHDLAGNISKQIELDSVTLIQHFLNEENLKKWQVNAANAITLFIPNTYEVYWNVSAKSLCDKMLDAYDVFWEKEENIKALNSLNMTKQEVITLASIVQKETLKNDEKPTVAGVYINRLKREMPLQADPTVVFAWKKFDLKRVLNKHLKINSPYNTYKFPGLPPGPICMPDLSSVKAVLNYKKHRFLYFCAKPDYSGYHKFAKNLVQHNKNARVYHRWLNKQKIK